MRVYTSTYAKYNKGDLYGKWLDLEDYTDLEDFIEACKKIHSDEEDPELMFQDWDGLPEGTVSECTVDEALWDFLELDQPDREMIEAFMSGTQESLAYALEHAEDCFLGRWDDMSDYAYHLFNKTAPKEVQESTFSNYIDFEHLGRDLELDGLLFIDGHLFKVEQNSQHY